MKRIKVKSSDIISVGYDKKLAILEVEFKRGGIYQYVNIPENVYKELMAADSIGSHFSRHIRDNYQNSKI